jgi:hypothetical protein
VTTLRRPATQERDEALRRQALSDVLRETGSEVVEVTSRASAGGGWQLRLATPDGSATWTVLVGPDAASAADVLAEADLIIALRATARPGLKSTMPEPVCLVDVGRRTGVMLTDLPGSPMLTGPVALDVAPETAQLHFDGALGWLRTLWAATEGDFAPIRYGENTCGADLPELVLHQLARSLQQLHAQYTPRSAVHGSTSPVTLRMADHAVVGVDDWRRAVLCGEPLADLVGFAIRYAPQSLAEIATAEHTWYADMVRRYLCVGLDLLGADPAHWLDLLVVGAAEALTNEPPAVAEGARDFLLSLTS